MTIERRDGRLISVIKTKNPLRAFVGERTWSPQSRDSKPIVIENNTFFGTGNEQVVGVLDEDKLVHIRARSILGHIYDADSSVVRSEDINSPDRPWAGKVRWRKTPAEATIQTKVASG